MSAAAAEVKQPESFAFDAANAEKARAIIARYPDGRQASAVLPLLDLAQRQHDNWLPQAAIEHVAALLDMPRIRVLEVATFYTMFNLSPVGKFLLQLCGTTPCWLRGADDLKAAIREECGIGVGETSADGVFTLMEVECLGACVNAPMIQINDDFYEDLDKASTVKLLKSLRNGENPAPGSAVGRHSSEPAGGRTTLLQLVEASPAPTPNADNDGDDDAPAPSLDDPARPPALDAAREGGADDLKRISGVGPKIEGILNELGIFHFDQVAAWTEAQKDWVNGYLRFKGRIDREKWLEQAATLAKEGNG